MEKKYNLSDTLAEDYLVEYDKLQSYRDAIDQKRYYEVPDWFYQQEFGVTGRQGLFDLLDKEKERKRKINTYNKYYRKYYAKYEYDYTEEEKEARKAFIDKLNTEGIVDSDLFHKIFDDFIDVLIDAMRNSNEKKILFTENDLFDDNGDIKYNKLKTIKNMVTPAGCFYYVLDLIIKAKDAGKIKNLPEEKPAEQTPTQKVIASKDYSDDASAKQFWADINKNEINIDAFHKAYDDALKAANCPDDIWDEKGQLKGKYVWGKIKALDNSLASVRALRKLWGATFMKNENLNENINEYRIVLADYQDDDGYHQEAVEYLLKPGQTKGDLAKYLSYDCGYVGIWVHDGRPASDDEIKQADNLGFEVHPDIVDDNPEWFGDADDFDEALTEGGQKGPRVPGLESVDSILGMPWFVKREGNNYLGLDDPKDEIGKLLSKVNVSKFPNRRAGAERLARGIINNILREMSDRRPNELKDVIDTKIIEGINSGFDGSNPVDAYKKEYARVKGLSFVSDSDKENALEETTKKYLANCHKALLTEAIVRRFFEADLQKLKDEKKAGATRTLNSLSAADIEEAKKWLKQHVNKIFFSVPLVDDSDEYIGDESIPLDDYEKREASDKRQKDRFQDILDAFEKQYPEAIEGIDFEYRKTSHSSDPRKDLWNLACRTYFDVKVADVPELIKNMIDTAKRQSLQATKLTAEIKDDMFVDSCPFAQAVLKLFNDDINFYKRKEIKPTRFGDAFDSVMPDIDTKD